MFDFNKKQHLLVDTPPFSKWVFVPRLYIDDKKPHINFRLVSVGERTHRNSEGWEKYEITHTLYCHKEYVDYNDAYSHFSSLYVRLKNEVGTPSLYALFESENLICDKIDKEEVLVDWY